MEDKYVEYLAEIAVKRYSDMVGHALKLEAKVADLNQQVKSLTEENQSLIKKLEVKNKRTSAKTSDFE